MQSIDTNNQEAEQPGEGRKLVDACSVEELAEGSCKTIELSGGRELALFRVNGEYYATENLCPHQGAPLAEGTLCDHVIECQLHGWQFDVRTGECLTVQERISTYEVAVDDGAVKILV